MPPSFPTDPFLPRKWHCSVFQQLPSESCSGPVSPASLKEGEEEKSPTFPSGFRGVARAESPAVSGQGDPIQRSLCPSFPSASPHWVSCKGKLSLRLAPHLKQDGSHGTTREQTGNLLLLLPAVCSHSLSTHCMHFPKCFCAFCTRGGRV